LVINSSLHYDARSENQMIVLLIIIIIVLAIAYQCHCAPSHDYVAELSERSLVSLPASCTSTFHFHPEPLCASPSFGYLNNLRVLCSLSVNSPKFVEPEHSYKSFKNLAWNPVLSQFNPVHIFITLFQTSALVLPTHLWPSLSRSYTLPLHFREHCVRARVCVRERMLPHACYLFLHLLIIFIFHGSTALVCLGQLIAEVPISPSAKHTHTLGGTPLEDWPARPRDLYLATRNTTKRQTSMPLVGSQQARGRRPTP
jgi:hypothetical protein